MARKRCGMHRRWWALLLPVTLAGCAAHRPHPSPLPPPTGDATWHRVEPQHQRRYQLAMGEEATGASVDTRVTPVYPASLLAACPPTVQLQALLIVGRTGNVEEVRVDGEAQSDVQRRLFVASVRSAALQWKFKPLEFDQWVDEPDGTRHVASRRTSPFSATYVFRFACHAGHASVSADGAAHH